MPFASLGLSPSLLRGVRAAGYTEPTPIQRKAIPIILEGRDLIGAAQTGTGKTAAFVLPVLERLLPHPGRLRALVLTPTRELAAQVETNARDYARFTRLRVGVVYGGVPIGPQERLLREQGVDLLVATPGRLLDLHGRQSVSLEDVEVLVLDEADRMVDMGFAPDLRRILRLLRQNRQTLMFSATMPAELNRVAKEALIEPYRVDLAPPSRPAAGITQAIYPVPRELKTDLLDEILSRGEVRSMLVFTRTKHGADRLARQLHRRGYSVVPIHGNRSQSQRQNALEDLRRGRVQILVATDIASRGIDVEGISHVVNFDVPHTPEDYVHRIGRTGRVEAVGDAFTLMGPEEREGVAEIERFLGRTIPRVMLPDFDYRMKPSEIMQVVSHGERHAPARATRRGAAPTKRRAPRGDRRGAESGTGHGHQAAALDRADRPATGAAATPSRARGGAAPATSRPPAAHGRPPRRSSPTDRRGRGRL